MFSIVYIGLGSHPVSPTIFVSRAETSPLTTETGLDLRRAFLRAAPDKFIQPVEQYAPSPVKPPMIDRHHRPVFRCPITGG